MCAYSTINGHYACQNPYLEKTTLDQRWGFPGFVTSDYGAIHATSAALDGTGPAAPSNARTTASNSSPTTAPSAICNATAC